MAQRGAARWPQASLAPMPCRYISWAIAPATFGALKLVPLQPSPAAVLVDDRSATVAAVVERREERAHHVHAGRAHVDPRPEVGERCPPVRGRGAADGDHARERRWVVRAGRTEFPAEATTTAVRSRRRIAPAMGGGRSSVP